MDTSKIIKGVVNSGRYTVTAPIVKEDYGLYLQIEGVELPETYEVDFSNSEHSGTSVTMIGNSDGVLIPSQFISSGKDVFAFLYHVGANYGRTVYKFRIPNKCRPDRTNEQPTPEEQSTIDQCISALNEAVETAEESAESAQENADFLRNATATTTILPVGSDATVTLTDGEFTFGIPRVESGEDALSVEITNPRMTIPVGSDGYTTKQVMIKPIISAYKGTRAVDYNLVTAGGITVLTRNGDIWSIPPEVTTGKNNPPEWTIPADRRFWSNTGELSITVTVEGQTVNLSYGYTVLSDGADGQDGYSPTVSITDITGGHRITITDEDGVKTFDVMDGDDYTLTAQDKQDIASLVDVSNYNGVVSGTTLASNNKVGFYSVGGFSTAVVSQMTDMPCDDFAGGYLLNAYVGSAGTVIKQTLVENGSGTTVGRTFTRVGSGSWFGQGYINWVAFGDSITHGSYSNAQGQTLNNSKYSYAFRIAKNLRHDAVAKFYNCAVRGIGWVNTGNNGETFSDMMALFTGDKTSINLVTIMLGINDYISLETLGTTSSAENDGTISGAIRYGLRYLCENYPNAKIIAISPLNSMNHGSANTGWSRNTRLTLPGTLQDVCDMIAYWCNVYNVTYINEISESFLNNYNMPTYLKDNLHPTDEGQWMLARELSEKIFTGVSSHDGTGKVDDVQINGTSIVQDGVANVPVANANNLGAVKVNGSATYTGIGQNNGLLYISKAPDTHVKAGSNENEPIVPSNQHQSVFYGLAKSAGADEKNSALPVGEYTEEAKVAIQKMLGIYEAPWELIREDTFTNTEEANHIIDVDANGETFELTDVVLLFETPKQAAVSSKGQYGDISFFANGASLTQAECGAWTQNANDPAHGVTIMIRQEGKMLITTVASQATNSNNGNVRWRYGATFDSNVQSVRYLQNRVAITSINIIKVLGTGHYKLYGRRKWQ